MAVLIAAQREQHRIPHATACRALGVSRSWFYKWKDGTLTPRAARRAALAAEVLRLFKAHRGTYGSPRITAGLRQAGWRVSENTVAAVARELGLAAPAPEEAEIHDPAGEGPLAGAGPGQARLPRAQAHYQVVRRRDRDQDRRRQALPGLSPGHSLPAGARVRVRRVP